MNSFTWPKIIHSLVTQDLKHLSMSVKFDLDVNQCHKADNKGEKLLKRTLKCWRLGASLMTPSISFSVLNGILT